ncbi:ribonuclease R [Metamycoplasma subdolum]|uniref:Ribonuclease R n=1 Tax=Metamycoplasma subdolum TaxID=92407 RepID=A0A3M0AHE7_9BACT|nr:ribonuclease R [Metamycoplasma subdolum]RMA78652.1 ribonuclease R [Metamycoplasma subdolum]WPB50746.1 ribonuclease R [Metamycoplasma subdolum]
MNNFRDNKVKKNLKLQKDEVLNFISSNSKVNFIKLAKSLKIPHYLNKELTLIIKELIKDKKIEIDRNDFYQAINFLKQVEAEIAITSKRLGFIDFKNENGEELSAFIPPSLIKNALNKDLLKVDIFSYKGEEGQTLYKAIPLELKKHNQKYIIGKIQRFEHKVFFDPLNEKDKGNYFFVNKAFLKNLKNDDIIRVEVLEPNDAAILIKFDMLVSNLQDPLYPTKSVIASNGVETEFSEEVIEASKKLPKEVSGEEIKQRKNLINLLTVTIDGLDTKDFDDAISCYKLENGNFKLFIHIADVSYYVKENDLIDEEALRRGTSIYLLSKVVPMLPFELSNGICSLNPDVVRNCLTLELEIDKLGNNKDVKIYPSSIKSDYRLTYNEVNDYYDKKIDVPQEISTLLDTSLELSKIIRKRKLEEGYIDFEITETKVIMEGDKVVDIIARSEGISEKLIEDFMVRANETVAKMMEENKFPSIYRVHDAPADEKLGILQGILDFLKMQDLKVPYDKNPKSFSKVVENVKSRRFDEYVKMMLLRTQQKAKYTSDNIGHFGLASKSYSHFTSPIRRYPDLLLHRLIREFIFNKKFDKEKYDLYKEKIEKIAIQNSESENVAVSVERDIVDIKKSEFFTQFVGKTFNAQVTSIEKFGIFFNIEPYQVSTLARFENLGDNIVKINDFLAKGNKTEIKVGSFYNIKIDSVDLEKGKINALLA